MKYHKHFKINVANYKEIKHEEGVNEQKEFTTQDKFEQKYDFESEQEYNTPTKTQNERETYIEREIEEKNDKFDSGSMMREKTGGKTDHTKEIFSIKCTLTRNYDQLTEVCNNTEIFNKLRN